MSAGDKYEATKEMDYQKHAAIALFTKAAETAFVNEEPFNEREWWDNHIIENYNSGNSTSSNWLGSLFDYGYSGAGYQDVVGSVPAISNFYQDRSIGSVIDDTKF